MFCMHMCRSQFNLYVFAMPLQSSDLNAFSAITQFCGITLSSMPGSCTLSCSVCCVFSFVCVVSLNVGRMWCAVYVCIIFVWLCMHIVAMTSLSGLSSVQFVDGHL